MLNQQLPWFIAGPALGLCVVAFRLLLNGRLGVTGGYSEIISRLRIGSVRFDWRGWFLIGVVLGGLLFALAAGGPDFHNYGWLTQTLTGSDRVLVAPILFAAGLLIGYGAKLAGGCTSGNGLSGSAMLSRASLLATATFFGVAIIVSFLSRAIA
jgi:uncharacterized membrane protein YedE/YeeE